VGGPRAVSTASRSIRRAVCPGSFDPVTNGHLDVIARAAGLFDHVTVLVAINAAKQGMFTVEERVDMLREVTGNLPNVSVDSPSGLLVDFCKAHGIPVIVRGLRSVSDLDYELQMARMNHSLEGVDTLFMSASPECGFVASSLVKEIARWGGDVGALVPPAVHKRILERGLEPRASDLDV
jgi:pantetheine-phosphate adenylyltransferase